MSAILFCFVSFIFLIYALMLVVYLVTWLKITKPVAAIQSNLFVTVIVPVRNEESNILAFLNGIARQSYNKTLFEIVIVNDHSNDRTLQLAETFKSEHKELDIVLISLNETYSKKAAITAGVHVARGELIITTDADCTFQEAWIHTFASCFLKYLPEMIIAPVLINAKDSFFQHFQQYDFMAMQISGLASAELGFPLLCSGANLAFKKAAFIAVNGFEGNEMIASGDDVFLYLKMKKQYPDGIKVLADQKAIVTTLSQLSVKDFIEQRHRWGGKVRHYKNNYILIVGGIVLAVNLILFFDAIASFQSHEWVKIFTGCLALKVIADFVFLKAGARFFLIRINILNFLFAELFYPFYFLWLIARGISGKAEWKGRILKG